MPKHNIIKNMEWNGIDKFNGKEKLLKNWIFTLSKTTAIDILRKEKNHIKKTTELIDHVHTNNDLEEVIKNENFKELEKNLSRLKKDEKKLIDDRYYKNKSVKDIANDLEITPNAASLRINRIIEKIKLLYKRGV